MWQQKKNERDSKWLRRCSPPREAKGKSVRVYGGGYARECDGGTTKKKVRASELERIAGRGLGVGGYR